MVVIVVEETSAVEIMEMAAVVAAAVVCLKFMRKSFALQLQLHFRRALLSKNFQTFPNFYNFF